jgi:N-acetylmuramic acid 6-phosphate etherase
MDADSFLKVCHQFRLGELVTEQPHPETTGLAELAQSDPLRALEMFHRVDRMAMDRLEGSLEKLPDLVRSMRETLASGGRIFLAGCGATGRLALTLETFAREAWLGSGQEDRIISLMAGGDAALIRSIESFEDFPEYGQRQLRELGYSDSDLLVAITEGGETPWVIGACMEAAAVANRKPWFLFCNPPDLLRKLADRSARVLDSPDVHSFFLDIGPMALAGSTRLQATTVQMLVTGAALSEALGHESALDLVNGFRDLLNGRDYAGMAAFVEAESTVYRDGNCVLYQTDHYGMTVLTDTTERSPTFSLAPFENRYRNEEASSWCYLSLPQYLDSTAAWNGLLMRPPRTLEWINFQDKASLQTLLGYDISDQAPDWRRERISGKSQLPYLVHGRDVHLEFAGHSQSLELEGLPLLLKQLFLKCCLNAQSTLVMGRLGLFESNLMTHVKPSNYKLIDRAARHVQHRHHQVTGESLPYETAVRQVFQTIQ